MKKSTSGLNERNVLPSLSIAIFESGGTPTLAPLKITLTLSNNEQNVFKEKENHCLLTEEQMWL